MEVKFFTFNKKYNSTKRPDLSSGVSYNCVLKSSSNVITPTIELQIGLTVNPSVYNFCYIEDYNRYYWVREWTFVNRLWVAELNVDVLATWKPYIGNTDMYVYRSSNEYDGKVMDKKYTVIAETTISKVDISPLAKRFSDGYFVLGIYGNNNNSTTMAYYSISASDFGTFMSEIYTKGVLDDNIWSGVIKGIRNSIFDISAYIKSCKWFPDDPGDFATARTTIEIGALTITCNNKRIWNNSTGVAISGGTGLIQIPKHPQANSRGLYCNISPYSRYKLVYLPFGTFELDSTVVGLYTYLYATYDVDAISGEAVLNVFVSNDSQGANSHLLFTKTVQYAVDIPIAVSSPNVASIGNSLIGGGISTVQGNYFSRLVADIGSILEAQLPALDTISNNAGGLVTLDYTHNRLMGIFYTLADEDNNSNGRPLCKVRKPSNLGGYIEGESGTFSAPATITEMEEIRNFIDSGFYYE